MTNTDFTSVVNTQLALCKSIMTSKRDDYNDVEDDRFDGFKRAAALQNCTVKQALAGMMAKHTTSIYDMCESLETFSTEKWDEKITDHINYLLLLRGIVEEESRNEKCK